jgi:acid stress-induced BolA-like protein IbaG/YrbA
MLYIIIAFALLGLTIYSNPITDAFNKMFKSDKRGKVSKSRTKEKKNDLSVQEKINIKEIKDNILYTKDGYLFSYLKISSKSVGLLTNKSLELYTRNITAEFTGDTNVVKVIAISKPIDLADSINNMQTIYSESMDFIQRDLLKKEIEATSEMANSGESSEREFYFPVWVKNSQDAKFILNQRVNEIIARFEEVGDTITLCQSSDMFKLFFLFNNPDTISVDDNFDFNLPIIG